MLADCLAACEADDITKSGILSVVNEVYRKSTKNKVSYNMQVILVEQSVRILHAASERDN